MTKKKSLIPTVAIEAMETAFRHGLKKHEEGDWQYYKTKEVVAKIKRHTEAIFDGHIFDSEGNNHYGAVMADWAILYAIMTANERKFFK
ncbi:MAG: dATP/dGTP diphosphohydrolase domain-containing protein [Euryarchaeota archaeon]|nr:dATP/dGTP diphosphohydrolase domain-containing protein [Euryarchaeota archaeon]